MTYDFDKETDRHGTGALKTDALAERYGAADLLPLWVADMDFATPDFIIDALRQRLEHPILGYATLPADYWPAVVDWTRTHHGWDIQPEWLTSVPGIVKGIGLAVGVFTRPGDKVIIQPPVYHPFRLVPQALGREVVYNPLVETASDGGSAYTMDFDQLATVADERCRLLILSNPHNPGGVCWSPQTLRRLAAFCDERGIVVISDEIHCDMALYGNRHTPFATVSEAAARCSLTFQAPTKTFNIAALAAGYAIVPSAELRHRYFDRLKACELDEPHLSVPIATIAAYRYGEPWRQQMLRYVERNIDYVIDYCRTNIPAIRPLRPQASFLVWTDCRQLGLTHRQLVDLFVDRARLALNDGAMFGPGGEGFMRLNVATPTAVLRRAMEQLAQAVAALPPRPPCLDRPGPA